MKHHPKSKTWHRDIPDSVLLCCGRRYTSIPSAESLHPTLATIERAVIDEEDQARAIIAAWAFHFPVAYTQTEVCHA